MAFFYYLYDENFNNTIIDKSLTSFAPLPPNKGEIYIDFTVPETQPLYFYKESGGIIVENDQATINEYLNTQFTGRTGEDNINYGVFTAYTTTNDVKVENIKNNLSSLESKFNSYTGSTDLQNITEVGATTDIETAFAGGIKTNTIKVLDDNKNAFQLKTASDKVFLNLDTISGFTGINTENPKYQIHLFGDKNLCEDYLWGLQGNGVFLDGLNSIDKDIVWGVDGKPAWVAEIYRNENGKYWYLYNHNSLVTPFTVSDSGRIGVNNPTNIMYPFALINNINALDDLRVEGLYDKNYVTVFQVKIINTGTTDSFVWRCSKDEGVTYSDWSSEVQITTDSQLLDSGVYIRFNNYTGHTINSQWEFIANPQLPAGNFVIYPNIFDLILLTDDYTQSEIKYKNYSGRLNVKEEGLEPISIFSTGTTNSAIFIGIKSKTSSIIFDIDDDKGGLGLSLIIEYWNGDEWKDISIGNPYYLDNTNNLQRGGGVIWDDSELNDWDAYKIFDEFDELYWLRIRSASIVQKSPLVNWITRNGVYKFGVFESQNTHRPSFYMDYKGRVNIGGGTITEKNILQINKNVNYDVTDYFPSLVELDSEDSGVIDLKLKLSSNDNIGAGVRFSKTRGSLTSSSNVLSGDTLGHISFNGLVNNKGTLINEIKGVYEGDGNTKYGSIVFSTASGSEPTEKLRIDSVGVGIGKKPTAYLDIKSGSTTVASLKLNKGSLLTTPQEGAFEFNGNNIYFTFTGGIRKTFAFLESPVFTGNPVLPETTKIGNNNLKYYIDYSGGTYNPLLTKKSDFDAFTGSTILWSKINFSGSKLSDLETRNAEDVNYINSSWDVDNVKETLDNITEHVNTTQTSGRVSPEISLIQLDLFRIKVLEGTGYIIYGNIFKKVSWNEKIITTTGFTEAGKYYVFVDIDANINISTIEPNKYEYIYLGSFVWRGGIDEIEQSPFVVDNQMGRIKNWINNVGIFIIDGGGSVGLLSANTTQIYSSPCKVQYGLLELALSGRSVVDRTTGDFYLIYFNKEGVNSDFYYQLVSNGEIFTEYWNDIHASSNVKLTGYSVTLTNGSVTGSSTSDLTAVLSADSYVYLESDGFYYMNRLIDVSWDGSKTILTLKSPYLGTGGTGTLVVDYALKTIPDGKWVKALILRTVSNNLVYVYPQSYYDSEETAKEAPIPFISDKYIKNTINLAYIVFSGGTKDFTGKIYDIRPLPFYYRAIGGDSGGGVTIHADLLGLTSDDHPQYLKTDGTRNLTGIQKYLTHPTFTSNTDIVDKKYVDDLNNLKLSISNFNVYSGTTVPTTYLSISNFNTYSAATKTIIDGKLSKTSFDFYSGTTAPATYLKISNFNVYSGTTVPATYLSISNFNTYSANTKTLIDTKAPLTSPAFSGTPTAPTAAVNTYTKQIATTEFVLNQASNTTPLMDGTAAIGTSYRYAREDHRHPTDTTRFAVAGGTISGAVNISGVTKFATTTCLVSTPPTACINMPTLFWDDTSKAISAVQLTGGSDQYFYSECLTNRTTRSISCVKAHGFTGTTFVGGCYEVTFSAQFGNARSNAIVYGAFKIDNVTQGSNVVTKTQVAGFTEYNTFTRNVSLSAGTHCFDIWFWNDGGTACVPISTIRIKRIL